MVDPDLLVTLPERQISNGLAEAIKMALTSDKELFDIFENKDIDENIDEIIIRSLNIKKSVVEQDEKESGLRKILNFGHTVGHGIETQQDGALYHGECVALGMLPMCSAGVRARLVPVLKKAGLPTELSLSGDELINVMTAVSHDKKSAADGIDAVLVNEIGSFEIKKLSLSEIEEKTKKIFA